MLIFSRLELFAHFLSELLKERKKEIKRLKAGRKLGYIRYASEDVY